jgi:hypothetical protein
LKIVNNKALEDRIQAIEKSMFTVVKALKEIRVNISELQENRNTQQDEYIKGSIGKPYRGDQQNGK